MGGRLCECTTRFTNQTAAGTPGHTHTDTMCPQVHPEVVTVSHPGTTEGSFPLEGKSTTKTPNENLDHKFQPDSETASVRLTLLRFPARRSSDGCSTYLLPRTAKYGKEHVVYKSSILDKLKKLRKNTAMTRNSSKNLHDCSCTQRRRFPGLQAEGRFPKANVDAKSTDPPGDTATRSGGRCAEPAAVEAAGTSPPRGRTAQGRRDEDSGRVHLPSLRCPDVHLETPPGRLTARRARPGRWLG